MIEKKLETFLSKNKQREFDYSKINYQNKKILVTGASGTIGFGLCKQLAKINPKIIIALDIGETELFYTELELKEEFPNNRFVFKLQDIKDSVGVDSIIKEYKPDIIFHAAAYKHVSILENNPRQAVLNNIMGTRNLIESANKHSVKKFINISTDKAANPISVMGGSKKIIEKMLTVGNFSKTKIIQVRFGNIIGSRGSVLPIFQRQIMKGGPITITDDKMVRYFISVEEAVYLSLYASKIGRNKQIYLLEMGEPIRIIDLADKLIKAYGLTPGKNFQISIIGKKPGEKYSEELFAKETEILEKTTIDKINIIKNKEKIPADFNKKVDQLINFCLKNTDPKLIRKKIFSLATNN